MINRKITSYYEDRDLYSIKNLGDGTKILTLAKIIDIQEDLVVVNDGTEEISIKINEPVNASKGDIVWIFAIKNKGELEIDKIVTSNINWANYKKFKEIKSYY